MPEDGKVSTVHMVRYARPCAYGPSLFAKVDNSVTYGETSTLSVCLPRNVKNVHHSAQMSRT